mgnify:CR=1 FL=1
MNMDTNKINDLAKILRQNQLTKLDLTEGDTRIVLEAGGRQAVVEMPVVSVENIAEVPVAEVPSVEKAEAPAGVEQKSPLVGTVYLAPQAGAEPFVQVGDKVKKGDVLCIVESMKMFNNIEAELEGTIAELAARFDMTAEMIVAFIDGLNASLEEQFDMETLAEDTKVCINIDFEKLYKLMIEYKAEHLSNLPQWDSIYDAETRKHFALEQKKSKTIVKGEKIGRNDPCPCGSGKKYKKCCGRNA